MKITVHNLGVLKEAEIDLKPLTVFVGPNNAGKTWLAYTIASIFGSYGFSKYLEEYIAAYAEHAPGVYPLLEHAIEQVAKNGIATIDLVRFAREYSETYFNNVAQVTQQHIAQFMGTQLASLDNLSISLVLDDATKKIMQRITDALVRGSIAGRRQKPLLNIFKNGGDRKLNMYTSTEFISISDITTDEVDEKIPFDVIKEWLTQSILNILHVSLYSDVYILPTERTTFITFPFTRKPGSEITILRERSRQEQTRQVISEPVNHFLQMIGSAFANGVEAAEQRAKEAENNPRIREYLRLADVLEQYILGGEVQFSPQESMLIPELGPDPGQKILFQPTKDNQLEVAIASSMVKELSPLALYLRYVARPDELLVIDEPEMNLHPEAQVKMMELIAMLVNAGLNILVTTHSPYLIDHLTNLLKAAEVEDKESIRDEFYLKQTGAFIPKESVSVYMIDQGRATSAIDEDGLITLNTFGEVSDRLSEIYFTL